MNYEVDRYGSHDWRKVGVNYILSHMTAARRVYGQRTVPVGWSLVVASLVLMLLPVGCADQSERILADLQSSNPNVRMRGAVRAGQTSNKAAVPLLVDRLEDNDEGVRFVSIKALERITGQTFDYRYESSAQERRDAIERWRQWLSQEYTQVITVTEPDSPPSPD